MWFTTEGNIQEYIFNTKDFIIGKLRMFLGYD